MSPTSIVYNTREEGLFFSAFLNPFVAITTIKMKKGQKKKYM